MLLAVLMVETEPPPPPALLLGVRISPPPRDDPGERPEWGREYSLKSGREWRVNTGTGALLSCTGIGYSKVKICIMIRIINN